MIAHVYSRNAYAVEADGWQKNAEASNSIDRYIQTLSQFRGSSDPVITWHKVNESDGAHGWAVISVWSGNTDDTYAGVAEASISSGTLTAPSVDVFVDGAEVVYFWIGDPNAGDLAPSSQTLRERLQFYLATSNEHTVELASVYRSNRGETGTAVSATNYDDGFASTTAVRPANRAPYKPVVSKPAAGGIVDASDGIDVSWDHSDPDADKQDSWALRVKTSSASSYDYYDAANDALSSSEVRNSGNTEATTLSGGLLNNAETYDLGIRTWDADDLQSSYSDTQTFDTSTKPTLSLNEPASTITDTNTPTVKWVYSDTEGDAQAHYQAEIYRAEDVPSGAAEPPDASAVWATGVIDSSATEVTVGEPLDNRDYTVFARVAQDGPLWSKWQSLDFTVDVAPPSPPATAPVSWDPDTAAISLVVSARLNLVPEPYDAYEDGVGALTAGSGVASVSHETKHPVSRLGSLKIEAS